MLNRRTFCKTLTALGMGMLLPKLPPTDSSPGSVTHANISITGLERSSTITPSGSTLAPILVVNPQYPDLDSLIERRADLWNDLNYAEIVGQYVDFDEFLGCDGDLPSRWAYCPFCDQRTVRSLEVGTHFFVCYWCDATGSGIDFYARIKGLSHWKQAANWWLC